jgi:hypothetical protein
MLPKSGGINDGVLQQVHEELQRLNSVYRKENEEMIK